MDRIFEKVIHEQLYDNLTKKSTLDSRQSGFRWLHSTVTTLLDLNNECRLNKDRSLTSKVVVLDLKNTFGRDGGKDGWTDGMRWDL